MSPKEYSVPQLSSLAVLLHQAFLQPMDGTSRRPWTKRMKDAVARAFRKRGVAVHSSERNAEWMVDVAVSELQTDEDPDHPFNHRRLLLACECEWSSKRLSRQNDFAKLADIRATRKVFIGSARGSRNALHSEVNGYLQFINGHELMEPGEEILVFLCDFRELGSTGGRAHAWIVKRGMKRPTRVPLE